MRDFFLEEMSTQDERYYGVEHGCVICLVSTEETSTRKRRSSVSFLSCLLTIRDIQHFNQRSLDDKQKHLSVVWTILFTLDRKTVLLR